MEHIYEKSRNIYEQLGSIRMSRAQLREAIAQMQQAEAIADSALRRARLVWAEFKNRSKPSQEFVDYGKR